MLFVIPESLSMNNMATVHYGNAVSYTMLSVKSYYKWQVLFAQMQLSSLYL